MKLLIKGLVLSLLVSTGLVAVEAKPTAKAPAAVELKSEIATQDVQIFTTDNADGKITPKTIEEAFVKEGFFISEHRDMNPPFMNYCKKPDYKIYNLFTVYRKDTVRNLAVEFPEIGLFTPMSMSIYSKDGKTISMGYLSASAAAKMMSIPEDHPEIVALGESLARALHAAMPNGKLEKSSYKMKKPTGDVVARASIELDEDADWEEVKDDFQMAFEGELASSGFVLAGFTDLGYDFEENNITAYQYYDTYSICMVKVIFEVAKLHPEAGAFAPCSMYMYQKKDDNKIHMAFPTVHKWISSMAIEDKPSLDILMEAQNKFEKILSKLTAKK